ncbi:MAG TPA: GlsB/YeaQ/YmgE family stress response membrane protein [Candidatus Saccharimonadales bacterium]|nr:GlsB/YeaQ/YmgE family stress response membrane protein [Candidatus Saccharimonadales bacterium]
MGIIGLIIFGGIVGWLASLVMHTDKQQGLVSNIVVGILGSILGGFVVKLFGGAGITGFNLYSIVVGILGAVILIAIVRAIAAGGHKHA